MIIALVNETSNLVSMTQAQLIAAGIDHQLRVDVCPAWDRKRAHCAYFTSLATVPDDAFPLVLLDDADVAGALGYHDNTPDGREYARVFARTIYSFGGGVLSGALSVAVTASHEAVEALGDTDCNDWSDAGAGFEVAKELCDPVEELYYDVSTRMGRVSVSDFVLPAWFDPTETGPYDHLDFLPAALTYTNGGYLIYRTVGQVQTTFDSKPVDIKAGTSYPEWPNGRSIAKLEAGSRTLRRLNDAPYTWADSGRVHNSVEAED